VAFYDFIRNGNSVIFSFIIASKNPNFTFVFHTNLSRTDDVTSGMKREFDVVDNKGFVPFLPDDIYDSKSVFDDWNVAGMGNVAFVSPLGMVGMTMRDESVFNWFPRVEVNVGLGTVNAFFVKFK
jgi:hypothetical protein